MFFEQILEEFNIDPWEVLAVRHTLREKSPKLDEMLPRLVIQKPELFNAVQRWQFTKKNEDQFLKVDYIAAFLGNEKYLEGNKKRAMFIGLFKRGAHQKLTRKQVLEHPDARALVELGAEKEAFVLPRNSVLRFDLSRIPDISNKYEGRLLVNWSNPIAFTQYVKVKNKPPRFPIHSITPRNSFEGKMPDWDELVVTWRQLRIIPDTWRDRLGDWRGIYLITDESDGKKYVGAAYGRYGLLQRWTDYKETGHGGNKLLKKRDPNNFTFTILQRLPPDMEKEEVRNQEETWKIRLHTRKHGLNEN